MRCRATSVLQLSLRGLTAGEPEAPLVDQLGDAVEINDRYWTDREPDAGYLAARKQILAAIEAGANDRPRLLEEADRSFAEYRESLPKD